jgi:hypothetical protein
VIIERGVPEEWENSLYFISDIIPCSRDSEMTDPFDHSPKPNNPDIQKALTDSIATVNTLSATNAILTRRLDETLAQAYSNHNYAPQPPALSASQYPKYSNTGTAASENQPSYANAARSPGVATIPKRPLKKTIPTPRTPTLPTQRNHPSRLIITSENNAKLPPKLRNFGEDTLRDTNKALQYAGLDKNYSIMDISMTATENIVVTGAKTTTAADLIPFGDTIMSILDPNNLIAPYTYSPDKQLFKVKLDNVPMSKVIDGISTTYKPSYIIDTLANTYTGWDANYAPIMTPTWLVKSRNKDNSTLVFTFDDPTKAQSFLDAGVFVCMGNRMSTSAYEEKKRAFYCATCGSMNHRTKDCTDRRCLKCTSKTHCTSDHPEDAPLKCVNCSQDHMYNDRNCYVYKKKMNLPAVPPSLAFKIPGRTKPPSHSSLYSQKLKLFESLYPDDEESKKSLKGLLDVAHAWDDDRNVDQFLNVANSVRPSGAPTLVAPSQPMDLDESDDFNPSLSQ